MRLKARFEKALKNALHEAGLEGAHDTKAPLSQRSARARNTDDQSAAALEAAKRAKLDPMQTAYQIAKHLLGKLDVETQVTITEPGFVNVRWSDNTIIEAIESGTQDIHAQRIVIDYSHPNIAKAMHVGHLRSTIIGDALARMHEYAGNTVIRQNHLGDWGSQFGMLVTEMNEHNNVRTNTLEDLETIYRAAKQRWKEDPKFAERARATTRKLQEGDAQCTKVWQQWTAASITHLETIYKTLDVSLRPTDIRAESAYNGDLEEIARALSAQKIANVNDGALCAYPKGFTNREGMPSKAIVRKSDGVWTYLATDLAALKYRSETLEANRVLYVVDIRQKEHLGQALAIARTAQFVNDATSVEHVAFGMMLDTKGHAFKSREGGTVPLETLIDAAIDAASKALKTRGGTTDKQKSEMIGIGALKYADLSKDRTSSYRYDPKQMLSLEGNTALYLQYTRARLARLADKAVEAKIEPRLGGVMQDIHERELALALARWPDAFDDALNKSRPHIVCDALYRMAKAGSTFYEHSAVLGEQAKNQAHRAALAQMTAARIAQGLTMLGIGVPDTI